MKIERVQIKNFRILKEFEVDFENDLSVIIGKNNAGKTSFLAILEKFLSTSKPEFAFDDFNIEEQNKICSFENSFTLEAENYLEPLLSLKLYIHYDDNDDISDASVFLLDLDEYIHYFIISLEYILTYEKYLRLLSDFKENKAKVSDRKFKDFIIKNINRYFSLRFRALEYNNEENSKNITLESIQQVISMQTIGAKRDVANEQGRSKSLSSLANKYYKNKGSDTAFPSLQQQLIETDGKLTEEYKGIFTPVVDEIKHMSYNPKEAEISIISSLVENPIFQNNTTVKYLHNDTLLPEDYNGLGYLNLFAIMFAIRINLDKLAKKNNPEEKPTPINLLFIEEPEAHTHPQMQYIFITNIKKILKKQCDEVVGFALQTIISTHSAHIVSQCDFQDIKYFYRYATEENNVKSRSLKDLYSSMVTSNDKDKQAEEKRAFRFVKQYVTLNRSELFFADKAILIEGDTERILITAMMKKFDESRKGEKEYVPLLSQNISVIEVGAYSQVFATFLGFIGIKTLIFTDLDCAEETTTKDGKKRKTKCPFNTATHTTNSAIKHFLGTDIIADVIKLTKEERISAYDSEKCNWITSKSGQLLLMFQMEENNYQPSSFEDAFLCCNLEFVVKNKDMFQGLKYRSKITSVSKDYYVIANDCVNSKTTFALDILMNGGSNNSDWVLPLYIREGFKWLLV